MALYKTIEYNEMLAHFVKFLCCMALVLTYLFCLNNLNIGMG